MANNLQEVAPRLIAQGLLALRGMNVMPRLVNSDYQGMASEKNQVINVPIPSAITAVDVTPGPTPPATADVAPTSVPIVMDQWVEAPFYLTDNDVMQAMNGTIPMQASEAVKSLANKVNAYIMGQYDGIYGFVGAPGTTPFANDAKAASEARRILNLQECPTGDRRLVLDLDAEANAISLPLFQQAHQAGTTTTQVEGEIGRKVGFDWWADPQVKTHVAGTITTGLSAKASTAQAVGTKAVVATTAATSGACALKKGDIITFAGDDQTYVLTADANQGSASSDVTLNILPGLKKALAGGEAVAVKGDHAVNLAFHRDAIAFVTRPLVQVSHPSVVTFSNTDPVSGITLRLEVTREHKRTRYSYDILFGAKLIRPELGCRVAG
jgi:hypothetical protein